MKSKEKKETRRAEMTRKVSSKAYREKSAGVPKAQD